MKEKFGGATDAARLLGVSLSSFNAMRAAETFIYEPTTQQLTKLTSEHLSNRGFLSRHHLVAPTLAGTKRPGGRWEFNLERLRHIRENGFPGVEHSSSRDTLKMAFGDAAGSDKSGVP